MSKNSIFGSTLIPAILVVTGTSIGWTSLASAQDQTETPEGYIDGLKGCQAIEDDALRLKCYDAAVGRVVTASDEGEVQIVDADAVKQTRRRLFGFSLPKLGLFGGDGEGEKIELLESVITKVRTSGRNTMFITIEEGDAVWRISNASSRTMRTRPGDSVVFKEAALGSYFIRINGRTGVKGRRVE